MSVTNDTICIAGSCVSSDKKSPGQACALTHGWCRWMSGSGCICVSQRSSIAPVSHGGWYTDGPLNSSNPGSNESFPAPFSFNYFNFSRRTPHVTFVPLEAPFFSGREINLEGTHFAGGSFARLHLCCFASFVYIYIYVFKASNMGLYLWQSTVITFIN